MPFGIRTFIMTMGPNLFYSIPYIGAMIDSKYLKEYRCPTCNKLLAKGNLHQKESVLEVKCRGCGMVCMFQGEDAEIITRRKELLAKGIIPDTESEV